MADVFRQNFRDSDIIARMSGDEFAILLADMTEDNVRVIRNRLDQDIEAFNARMNGSHRLSVSIGMAVHNHDTPSSIDELLRLADTRMYEEKQRKKLDKR
jgi:diguanylate cyclase (GGDEF)-like protein